MIDQPSNLTVKAIDNGKILMELEAMGLAITLDPDSATKLGLNMIRLAQIIKEKQSLALAQFKEVPFNGVSQIKEIGPVKFRGTSLFRRRDNGQNQP